MFRFFWESESPGKRTERYKKRDKVRAEGEEYERLANERYADSLKITDREEGWTDIT